MLFRSVLRYDRNTLAIRKYELPDGVDRLILSGSRMLLATSSGMAVIDGDEIRRYFIDRTTDGRLRVAEATR